jgi:hydroxyacylglutathione hydrolase
MKILDKLYGYIWQGKDNNCNSYLLAGVLSEGRHVLIDPGHGITPYYQEMGLERLAEAMRRDGLSSASIGLVILTHGHPDHCEAAITLREENQTIVAMHPADESSYQSLGGEVDLYLREGSLDLGVDEITAVQVLHSPGHTPGHITLYLPEQKALVAGDCIFYRSTGRVDLPGGDAGQLRQTIDRLSRLDIEYLLCGHAYGNPGIMKGESNIQENFHYIQRLI